MFTIGATFRDVLDNFAATVYAGLTMVDNLKLNLGFQYNADGAFLTTSGIGRGHRVFAFS